MKKTNAILVLNAGSSSLKFALYSSLLKNNLMEIYRGHFDNHGRPIRNFGAAVKKALSQLPSAHILATGHRVVHGGEAFYQPTPITPAVLNEIKKLTSLAPLHNPPNIACIEAAKKLLPSAKHVVIFDTAFHHTIPQKAFLYGIPYSLARKLKIRRYGFHGISHQYVFEQAKKKLGAKRTRRTISCHLGNGCSITAILNGKSVDTSMGFTPLEGVPMGTRSGDIDPAIIFHLARAGLPLKKIERMLQEESGLRGVSEISSDMRDIWKRAKEKDARALRTVEWFSYRIAKYVGAYAAALGGLDCLIFTGGLGEKAHYVRKSTLSYLAYLKAFRTLVISTDEEQKIAEEVLHIL